jgi:uncharacterized delta-60 repeat protein
VFRLLIGGFGRRDGMGTRTRAALTLGLVVSACAVLAMPARAHAAAGDLDPSFSADGITTDSARDSAWSVAIDSGGRIVTLGGGVVLRFRPDGKLDKTFSGDGRAKLPFFANALAVDAKDRVVAGGTAPTPGDTHHKRTFAVARLKADGKPDPSFSGDGQVVTPIGGPLSDSVTGVAIDRQGRIVAAGASGKNSGSEEFALARYLPNGSLDTSFSGDGQARTQFPYAAGGRAVAIDSNGRIVVAGTEGDDFALARYTPAGNLDGSFSGDGTVTTAVTPPSYNGATTIAIDDLDRIVVGGENEDGFALARYLPDGTLDPDFSGDGTAYASFGYDVSLDYGLAIDDQGRVIASGSAWDAVGSDTRVVFALARFTPSGALDRGFSRDGLVTTSIARETWGRGVALDSQGRILVAGSAHGHAVVARYLGG